MSNYALINSSTDLQKYLDFLLGTKQKVIALDTEANNQRYAYGQQLCLIQIFDGTSSVIIDPFNIKDGNLGNLFENRDILKIIYDAPNDISLLVNSKNMTIKSILDIRPVTCPPETDLPPGNETSFMLDWKLRKGALNGQKVLYGREDYQQAS